MPSDFFRPVILQIGKVFVQVILKMQKYIDLFVQMWHIIDKEENTSGKNERGCLYEGYHQWKKN